MNPSAYNKKKKTDKPLILLCNDDGVTAEGLAALRRAVHGLGEIWVVAPDSERSACSLSLTLYRPLRLRKIGPRCFSVDGTPADCVYMAVQKVLPRRPDLLISGINPGPNLARQDISYSGTVAGALQGNFLGIPAMSVSLLHDGKGRFSFPHASKVVRAFAEKILKDPQDPRITLNVNIPAPPFKGVRVTILGEKRYDPEIEEMEDPRGRTYYWVGTGTPRTTGGPGSDIQAVEEGYVSVTPIYPDMTDYEFAVGTGLKRLASSISSAGGPTRKTPAGARSERSR